MDDVATGSPRDVANAYLAALSRHDFGALEQVVAADYRHHSNGVDFDFPGLRARTSWLIGGLPDLRVTPESFVCEDDAVAVRWLAEGTHHGSLNGERPTGHPVRFPGITMFHVADTRVVEDWQMFDERHLYVSDLRQGSSTSHHS